ncbi:hypothetical protein [Haliangium sp.]|uniref:hypothetical protein n=1 Tax=Haliangium sp. TaxID=2663208 RepID=UPI003D0D5B47
MPVMLYDENAKRSRSSTLDGMPWSWSTIAQPVSEPVPSKSASTRTKIPEPIRDYPVPTPPREQDETHTLLKDGQEEAVARFSARLAFRKLFKLRDERAEMLFGIMVTHVDAETLLAAGLQEYDEKGNQDRLRLITSLLREKGREAIHVLRQVAGNPFDGQEAFVDLIAYNEWIAPGERVRMLQRLARSANADTRWRVLHVATELPTDMGAPLLKQLCEDEDEEIREEAVHLYEDVFGGSTSCVEGPR